VKSYISSAESSCILTLRAMPLALKPTVHVVLKLFLWEPSCQSRLKHFLWKKTQVQKMLTAVPNCLHRSHKSTGSASGLPVHLGAFCDWLISISKAVISSRQAASVPCNVRCAQKRHRDLQLASEFQNLCLCVRITSISCSTEHVVCVCVRVPLLVLLLVPRSRTRRSKYPLHREPSWPSA
jgi:hypothetical protein